MAYPPPSGARVSERTGKAIPNGGQGSDVRGPRRPLRDVEHPAVLREGVAAERYPLSVKAVWSSGQHSPGLLDLPLVGLMRTVHMIFSILTAVSQPLLFCSAVARWRQSGGE